MKITNVVGLTVMRDEELFVADTLDHFAGFCDRGIVVVVDGRSTDRTFAIAKKHPAVIVARRKKVETKWVKRQTTLRLEALAIGRTFKPEWFLYFDADERLEFDMQIPSAMFDSVMIRLFDAYLTEDDHAPLTMPPQRKWWGPEYRQIRVLFRNHPRIRFRGLYAREPQGCVKVFAGGYMQHYSKAVSVEHWERKCRHYEQETPRFAKKWRARRGKAIHVKSDFGRPLMRWHERDKKGVRLRYQNERKR